MLHALSNSAINRPLYERADVDRTLLEAFENPMTLAGSTSSIHIECPEFTSLCPLTGQPDFATIVIDYCPDLLCVESKALKLYLTSFRNHGGFHEECVQMITAALVTLLNPKSITVTGRFTPRGGIPFWPRISWEQPRGEAC